MRNKDSPREGTVAGPTIPSVLGSFVLKDHQVEAVSGAFVELSSNDRCQVVMACGAGKTLVGAAVGVSLSARRILVLMPSLALVKQTISAYRAFGMDVGRRFVAVCSDVGVAEDDIVVPASEIEAEVASDENLRVGDLVCFCTYISADALGGLDFDLIVFDEAHRTSGSVEKVFGFALSDANVSAKKRLFLTATPRYEEDFGDGGYLVHSMDDVAVYGNKSYDLTFQEAVRRGCCVDYEILIICVKEGIDGGSPKALMVAADKAVSEFGVTKIFSFHGTVKDAVLLAGVNIKGSLLRPFHVNGAMATHKRKKILDDFSSSKVALVSNVRCLSEGVDVPHADAVFFVVAKKGTVDIAQACGRIMRPFPGKKRCFIVLPLLFRRDEDLGDVDILCKGSRFQKLVKVLRALKSQDSSLADALPRFGDVRGPSKIPKTTIVGVELSGRELDRLREAITLKLVVSFGRDPSWKKTELMRWATEGKLKPSVRSAGSTEEKRLADSFHHYTTLKSYMYDEGFTNSLKAVAPHWFVQGRVARKMSILLEMARRGDRRPSPHSDDEEERMLGTFIADMFRRRVKRDADFADEIVRLNPSWSNKHRIDSMWDDVFARARRGEERPRQQAKDDEERKLGVFLSSVVTRKRKRGLSVEEAEKLEEIQKLVPLWFARSYPRPRR